MRLMTTTAAAAFLGFQATAATFFTFQVPDCPGAGATAINNNGVVTGSCGTGNGFLRDPSGHFTLFNAGGPTVPTAINNSGAVTGSYVGSEPPIPFARTFGFIRSADGAITTINLEGIFAPISPNGINAHGDIVGGVGGIGANPFWFLRADAGGVITAPLGFFEGTAIAINEIGEIAGSAQDVSDVPHGGVLEPDSHTMRGAQPAGAHTASFPVGINRSGTVAGVFVLRQRDRPRGGKSQTTVKTGGETS
jgi:hypothetical protein